MTESGKTTLAKKIAQESLNNGRMVLVLDPIGDNWPASYYTTSPDEFLRVFWDTKNCDVFIDESGDVIGRSHADLMARTATRGRHWGHNCYYIAQRAAQLTRTVRDQCSFMFLFASSFVDCKMHAEEWNREELLNARNLPKGKCFYVQRFGKPKLVNVFGE